MLSRRVRSQMSCAASMQWAVVFAGCLALCLQGCVGGPPAERGPLRQPDLVELIRVDPTIKLDIRYATANNFLGRPVYPEARAFLQRPAAEAGGRGPAAQGPAGAGRRGYGGE
ncbi:MAG: hypothetical protein AB1714_17275, partial [Acidobacteriota bacterium]